MDFDAQLAAFRDRTEDPGFEGLILLGTEQHNVTAALLLGTLAPRRVAFLTTPETRSFPQFIAGKLGRTAEGWDCPDADHSSTREVYRAVKALREQWADIENPARIAVDVTGGLKPMSIGLEKAAHLLELTTIYVQSDYGTLPDGRRGYLPGTQRLVVPPNPYLEFGDLEAAEARRIYASHDYTGAHRIFARLAAQVPERRDYSAQAKLAAAYAAWDSFDASEALLQLEQVLADTLPTSLAHERETLEAQRDQLHRLETNRVQLRERRSPEITFLRRSELVLPLLGSLHANALRREAQGRYDVAALLRYRCLELLSQQRLAGYGILTDAPRYEDAIRAHPTLARDYERIERSIFTRGRPRGMPGYQDSAKVTLFNGYMLLAALDDQLVAGYDIRQIREQSDARNRSALAHGFRPITRQEYDPFRDTVETMLDRFLAVSMIDRSSWESVYRFIALEAV